MVKFNHLRPILWTENFDETLNFYVEVLGFTINEKNDDWNWASLSKDEVGLMLAKPNEHEKFEKIGFTGSFYFNVKNVDELWENVKKKQKSATKSKIFLGKCESLQFTIPMATFFNLEKISKITDSKFNIFIMN